MNQYYAPDISAVKKVALRRPKAVYTRIALAVLMLFAGSQICVSIGILMMHRLFSVSLVSGSFKSNLLLEIFAYAVTIPMFILILSPEEKAVPKKRFLTAWETAGLLGSAFLALIAGSMLGNTVTSLFSQIIGGTYSGVVAGSVSTSDTLTVLVFSVLLPPLIEEFLFRKLILDRTLRYSRDGAIFFSALLFGLMHGNFEQFFYAFFIGFVFGYIYSKTGHILYTILLHMIINFNGVIVSQAVNDRGYAVIALVEFILAALGFVFLARKYYLRLAKRREADTERFSVHPSIAEPTLTTGDYISASVFNTGTIIMFSFALISSLLSVFTQLKK